MARAVYFLIVSLKTMIRCLLIFATHQALRLLWTSDDWYNDGTFSVCSEIFFQLYTTHAKSQERTIPCVYGLLPNKTGATYERYFTELRNQVAAAGDRSPRSMLFDFQAADISGCFLHLSSNVWEKIHASGLQ